MVGGWATHIEILVFGFIQRLFEIAMKFAKRGALSVFALPYNTVVWQLASLYVIIKPDPIFTVFKIAGCGKCKVGTMCITKDNIKVHQLRTHERCIFQEIENEKL